MHIRRMMRFDVEMIKDSLGADTSIEKYHSSKNSLGLICEIGDLILGYLCCNVDGELNEIAEIMVAPEVRWRGIGSAMLRELAATIGKDGTIEVLVPITRVDMIGFFKACGLKVVNSYMDNEKILLRYGWRFRHAPETKFRITKGAEDDDDDSMLP